MDARVKKFVAVAAIAGAIAAGSIGAATPAAADGWGRGWGHHGGGWGGPGRGWGRPGWGGYHGGRGGGWGAPVAAGVLGGLALGALAASSYQPNYYGGYGSYDAPSCYPARQPIVDDWGNVVAYRRVRVCN
jgi:hypothetical protein